MIGRVLQFECIRYSEAAEVTCHYLFQRMRSTSFEIHRFLDLQDKVRMTETIKQTHQVQVPQSQKHDQLFVALHVMA